MRTTLAVLLAVAVGTIALLIASTSLEREAEAGRQTNEAGTTKEQFDQWMKELSNWGRWGPDDQLGALNLITPAKRMEAVALVKEGTVVSLSRTPTLEDVETAQQEGANQPPVLRGSFRNVVGIDSEGQIAFERHEIEYHGAVLTHLDALCHLAYDGTIYNGLSFEEVTTVDGGCSKMGIMGVRDGIVTRGILLDIPGTAVRREHIGAWMERTGVEIAPGDALLLRSGSAEGESGGYDPSVLPYLKELDIALLGSDVAQEGGAVPGVGAPIHRFTLVALGVHLFDNLDLEALAESATRLQRWEFMFMAAPLPVPNGSGSAINPIAVW